MMVSAPDRRLPLTAGTEYANEVDPSLALRRADHGGEFRRMDKPSTTFIRGSLTKAADVFNCQNKVEKEKKKKKRSRAQKFARLPPSECARRV